MSILYTNLYGISVEGMMLKLKLQYFGHLMRRVDSLEKTLMLGGIGGRRRRGRQRWDGWMASLTQWTWVWVISGSWWWTGRPGVLRFMGLQRVDHNWATELTDWLTEGPSIFCQFIANNNVIFCYNSWKVLLSIYEAVCAFSVLTCLRKSVLCISIVKQIKDTPFYHWRNWVGKIN